MSLENKFGSEVFRARSALGLTQEQLAERIGKSTRSVQYIEKGKWMPKPETMLRLMIVLRISADAFCKEVKVSVPIYPKERELV